MRFLPISGAPVAHGPAVEDVIRRFHAEGRSCHTPDGTLLAPLVNYLVQSGIDFTLRFIPRQGYLVSRGAAPFDQPEIANANEGPVSGDSNRPANDTGADAPGAECVPQSALEPEQRPMAALDPRLLPAVTDALGFAALAARYVDDGRDLLGLVLPRPGEPKGDWVHVEPMF